MTFLLWRNANPQSVNCYWLFGQGVKHLDSWWLHRLNEIVVRKFLPNASVGIRSDSILSLRRSSQIFLSFVNIGRLWNSWCSLLVLCVDRLVDVPKSLVSVLFELLQVRLRRAAAASGLSPFRSDSLISCTRRDSRLVITVFQSDGLLLVFFIGIHRVSWTCLSHVRLLLNF